MINTTLEISILEIQHWTKKNLRNFHVAPYFPKKLCLGPQNNSGSLGPEKLLKIVNCAIIKENEKNERNNGGVPIGIEGFPPISMWINVMVKDLHP